ncbi:MULTISPECIES: hypothetical protein [Halobacterium]|uniref:hypothetical protein n=1 Tax=Halobacterium TaxID=2239 RepID=UPI00196500DA|nr:MULTISPECIES: hypothetical protein [Halobacterium]MCF2165568.1 hypothetical protein [Halobacterium salinarum]MCF2168336.1 hypothetical protein [Halobacterium salinarum]MCF2239486.1 hypothetical protein [Halobacterium salinarum]QRY23445.1 hypothetical protein JT689_05300 [Halobacterium sp. GSL-19]
MSMNTNINATESTVQSILWRNVRFKIPKYQRQYSWIEEQTLADTRYVNWEHEDLYKITMWRQLYLRGEVDAQNQPRPWSGRVFTW